MLDVTVASGSMPAWIPCPNAFRNLREKVLLLTQLNVNLNEFSYGAWNLVAFRED